MAADNANVWKDIELRIYTGPFWASCHISSIKKGWVQKFIKSKGAFQVGFMCIITATALKH